MILVDTSVWIDHLHKTTPALAGALEQAEVLTHPSVTASSRAAQSGIAWRFSDS
ncbi:MAG: hypothetical protein ABI779_11160 [Acidobacteriota bacterium]